MCSSVYAVIQRRFACQPSCFLGHHVLASQITTPFRAIHIVPPFRQKDTTQPKSTHPDPSVSSWSSESVPYSPPTLTITPSHPTSPSQILNLPSTPFTPRLTFPPHPHLTRSHYPGHHAVALSRIRTLLATNAVSLVIECRDARAPFSSTNAVLGDMVREWAGEKGWGWKGGRRVVVYLKGGLVGDVVGDRDSEGYGERDERSRRARVKAREWEALLRDREEDRDAHIFFLHNALAPLYTAPPQRIRRPNQPYPTRTHARNERQIRALLSLLRDFAHANYSLTGHQVLVIGMPNIGKSTLVNALRRVGVGGGKAAATGRLPGSTRKVGSPVKVLWGDDEWEKRREGGWEHLNGRNGVGPAGLIGATGTGLVATGRGESLPAGTEASPSPSPLTPRQPLGGPLTLLDTPGILPPYLPNSSTILSLALCGILPPSHVPHTILADFLLYHINRHDPSIYAEYCAPTNSVETWLNAVGRKTGRLKKGGRVDLDGVAAWVVGRWGRGGWGGFVVDEAEEGTAVEEKGLVMSDGMGEGRVVSMNQARKAEKERRRQKGRARARGFA